MYGWSYDGMGNLANSGSHTFTYDAEGRPVALDNNSVQIMYDAFGRAVEQNRSGVYTQILYSPSGQKFAFMNGATVQKYIVPLLGGMQAVYNASGLQYYRHSDWLGSNRFSGTPAGGVYFDQAYAPFGENYAGKGTTDRSFTGQTEDTVTGMLDFPFRQQHPVQGRWLVPDPAGLAAADVTNPQTWNRYAYVANNPLNATDPLGLYLDDCIQSGEDPWTCGHFDIGFPICIDCGRGGGHPPSTPPPNPPPAPPPPQQPINFPNETLGLPNGFPMRPWGIWSAFLPSNLSCPAELSSLCSGIDPAMGEDPLQDARIQALANGITQGAGQLTNPCTIGLFYGGSAVVGVAGGTAAGVATEGAVFPELGAAWNSSSYYIYQLNKWWRRLQPLQRRAAGAVGGAFVYAGGKLQEACNSLAKVNW